MKDKQMSLWGIGPAFVVLSILLTALSLFLSIRFDLLFRFTVVRVPLFVTGISLMIIGACLWAPAARTIDDCIRSGVLAERGVYGVVRNPIYSGFLFFLSGICVALQSPLMLPAPILIYLLLKLMLRNEDELLKDVFGRQYTEYKERVNQIIPNPVLIMSAWFYPADTSRYDEQLYILRDRDVNAFVYTDGDDYICIDAGYSAGRLREQFDTLNIDPALISVVFLTHTDTDHRGGLELFSQAELYMGRAEEQMINGAIKRKLFLRNKPLRRPYRLLDNGESISIGNIKVRAVATPGHTAGHSAYIVDERYLFTGDSVVHQNGQFKTFYRLINMDTPGAAVSAEKVKQLTEKGSRFVCTAHTGIVEI